jgi:hypothetical protein
MEQWDERTQEFVYEKEQTLQLEHSLVSLSKWESKWCKPFLSKTEKTREETIDYIKCMTMTQNVNPEVYLRVTDEIIKEVNKYIDAPMTATWFSKERGGRSSNEQTTSELIYYWMISLNIPFDCQKWHLNRLLILIKVCNLKNQPAKKMSRREVMSRNAALNAARRKQFNTNG